MPFPDLAARTVAGADLELPADFGERALVLMGFAKEHRVAAMGWIEPLGTLAAEAAGTRVLGLVVLPRGARLLRGVLERGVRSRLADPAQAALIAVAFADVAAFTAGLGLPDADEVVAAVVEASGAVLALARGPHTPEAERVLRRALGPAPVASGAR